MSFKENKKSFHFPSDKSKLGMPIIASLTRMLRYHLGSLAFGSFIIALVQFIRYLLSKVYDGGKGSFSFCGFSQ